MLEFLRLLGKYTLAFTISIVSSCIVFGLAVLLGLGFSFFFTEPLFLPLTMAFLFPVCVSAFVASFKVASEAYDIFCPSLIRNPPIIQPSQQNVLLNKINRNAEIISPLNENEIDAFKQSLAHKNPDEREKYAKQLTEYQNIMQDSCGITLLPIDQLSHPVTIEGVSRTANQEKSWTKVYDDAAICQWLKGQKTEPAIRCDLTDNRNKIRMYTGLPTWINNFIKKVRSMLSAKSNLPIQQQHSKSPSLTFFAAKDTPLSVNNEYDPELSSLPPRRPC